MYVPNSFDVTFRVCVDVNARASFSGAKTHPRSCIRTTRCLLLQGVSNQRAGQDTPQRLASRIYDASGSCSFLIARMTLFIATLNECFYAIRRRGVALLVRQDIEPVNENLSRSK
jgi:hypothetical protein